MDGTTFWILVGTLTVALIAVAAMCHDTYTRRKKYERRHSEAVAREQARQWEELEAKNRELAAQLHLLRNRRDNERYLGRIREMVETAAFTTAALKRERDLLETALAQADNLLMQLQTLGYDKEG